MQNQAAEAIQQAMLPHLDNTQMRQLSFALDFILSQYDIHPKDGVAIVDLGPSNDELMQAFLSAKQLEGCSSNTIRYYRTTIARMLSSTSKHLGHIRTEDLRSYLCNYELRSQCSKVSIDNVRRILSSFFSWLEAEDYILKSPIRRIRKIKTTRTVKEIYSDEALERMRDGAKTARDLAIVDLLASRCRQ